MPKKFLTRKRGTAAQIGKKFPVFGTPNPMHRPKVTSFSKIRKSNFMIEKEENEEPAAAEDEEPQVSENDPFWKHPPPWAKSKQYNENAEPDLSEMARKAETQHRARVLAYWIRHPELSEYEAEKRAFTDVPGGNIRALFGDTRSAITNLVDRLRGKKPKPKVVALEQIGEVEA